MIAYPYGTKDRFGEIQTIRTVVESSSQGVAQYEWAQGAMDGLAALVRAVQAAEEQVEKDETYWSEIMTGQDSEEAEDTGYLVGYAAGLRDAARIVAGERPVEMQERRPVHEHPHGVTDDPLVAAFRRMWPQRNTEFEVVFANGHRYNRAELRRSIRYNIRAQRAYKRRRTTT